MIRGYGRVSWCVFDYINVGIWTEFWKGKIVKGKGGSKKKYSKKGVQFDEYQTIRGEKEKKREKKESLLYKS